ncbi:MAG: right-handed parallel beta-helix repeat-containing protein [Lentisphaerae bacterium]|nr:right-handed parallel beta-helix repeat-containing protein [Lentisphaerota bacterium]
MQRTIPSLIAVLALAITTSSAQITDDFSQKGWELSPGTPGTLSCEKGALTIEDKAAPPGYATASKTFTVDTDTCPLFLVSVTQMSGNGSVKLIRMRPFEKKVALTINSPGLYAVDMHKRFGWKGVQQIQVCLYASGDEESITFDYVTFASALTAADQTRIKEQKAAGNYKLKALEPFAVVPLFQSCSYYFKSAKREALSVQFRKEGGKWQRAFQPPFIKEDAMYRGSIVDLKEDTAYELWIVGEADTTLAQESFRTWSSTVPVAKTIVLDETNFDGHLTIGEAGTADGWIKVTAKPGFVLRNDRTTPLISLYKARFVLLEGLTLRGGLKDAIQIKRCTHVRVANCDIAGWGRIGTQRFDLDGKFYTDSGHAINWDTAILISRSVGTVVERCYVHDPVSTAHSWYYSHPSGPQAVGIDKPRSTVLRYNDFIGSDRHRWNDGVEGSGNFHVDGGFNRDADIYGNLICFANDDAVEIDGGQTNVRVFDNKFEGCLCGVSIQGCMSSPSYVFRNLLVNMGDERGVGGQTIKTSAGPNGKSAVSYIFNNTCYGPSGDLRLVHNLRIVAKNNVFAGKVAIRGREKSHQSECDYNLLSTGEEGVEAHGILAAPKFVDPSRALFELQDDSPAIGAGIPIDNFAPGPNGHVDLGALPHGAKRILPRRPIPVSLDVSQLSFSAEDGQAGTTATVTAVVGGKGFSSPFTTRQNDAFDWFRVTPGEGMLESGKKVRFTVTLLPGKVTQRPVYRGAFLIRLANGYSRGVMVYAKTNVQAPVKPTREDVFVQYLEAEAPTGGNVRPPVTDADASGGKYVVVAEETGVPPSEYRFSVPRDGKYFILMRVRSEPPVGTHDSARIALDGAPVKDAHMRSKTSWTWTLAAQNSKSHLARLQALPLTAGEHTFRLGPREGIHVDLIAVTDNPSLFD